MRTASQSYELRVSCFVAAAFSAVALSACGPSPDVAKFKAQTDELKKELSAVTDERNSLRARVNRPEI